MSRFKLLPLLFLLFTLIACQSAGDETPTTVPPADEVATSIPADNVIVPDEQAPEMVVGLAMVDTIEIVILESFPVQVRATAIGNLPDGCTTLDTPPTITRVDQTFDVVLQTLRQADLMCTQALAPFSTTFDLDVLGLSAGTYTVQVNGTSATFTLAVDNVIPAQEPDLGTIGGLVWHDECATAESGDETLATGGCDLQADGTYLANGLRDQDEQGLAGIQVSLGAGECPATGLRTAFTDAAGAFTFADLEAGTYCVAVSSLETPNEGILIPGSWSIPNAGEITINLTNGENRLGADFGWDYQFLPEFENEVACENQGAFVTDITIPDNTVIGGGEPFLKTWRLENTGSCTWAGYRLVFDSGERMGTENELPLAATVAPGATVDVSIEFTAPTTLGTFRSDWILKDVEGNEFGLGEEGDGTYFVVIEVEEIVDTGERAEELANLGAADWRDTFVTATNWFLLDTANYKFELDENDGLLMRSKQTSTGEEWGLSSQPKLSDFYLQGKFVMGDTCSGKDRYGFLFRAPDVNEGYVFNISCDGHFRLYKWADNTFTALENWTRSGAIKTGPNATNEIGVMADGKTLKLYANGRLLAELQDGKFSEGRFGLLIGSANTEKLNVFVQEIAYWKLD